MAATRWGMPVLLENQTLQANVDLCKRCSLDFVELNVNFPEYQLHVLEENADLFRRTAEENGIFFTLHLDEYLNVSDFNPIIANAHMETVRRTIACAKKIGMPVLNMHMNHGVFMTLPTRKVQMFEQYSDLYLASIRRYRDMCAEAIGDADITVCVENLDGFRPIEQQAIDLMLESDRFALTWDIGHSHATDSVDVPFITARADRLRHFHIHDTAGKHDHLPLGTGEIDLHDRLTRATERGCTCVVEIKTGDALVESVKWLGNEEFLILNS